MAAWEDEALAAHMFPAFVPYSCPQPYPPATKDSWRLHGGGGCRPAPTSSSPSSFPGFGQLVAAEYLESCRQAQLLAWLSRVQPGWGPRPRAPGRCHAAVQVNPRCDAAVQCSLGRRTLQGRARDPSPSTGGGASSSPHPARGPEARAPRPVRFPRTVSMYSPLVFRRATASLERRPAPARSPEPEEGEEVAGKTTRKPWTQESDDQILAAVEKRRESSAGRPQLPSGEGGEGMAVQLAPGSPQSPEAGRAQGRGEEASEAARTPLQSTVRDKERLNFQFLEQKYGYYHCKDCNIRWESAYVWCVQGTNKVYFKQFCRTCQKSYNPYRVEDITCQSCKRNICSCPVRLRHVDPKRPHRQDLCGRCKGKRLSCDSTFSFKYLI